MGESDRTYARRLRQYGDEAAAYRAMIALDAGGMGSWQWDLAANEVTGDSCWLELFGVASGGRRPSRRGEGVRRDPSG